MTESGYASVKSLSDLRVRLNTDGHYDLRTEGGEHLGIIYDREVALRLVGAGLLSESVKTLKELREEIKNIEYSADSLSSEASSITYGIDDILKGLNAAI
jgi:hypothetical protein